MTRTPLLALAGASLLCMPAWSQVSTALVREGDAPAGLPAGQVITSITDPAVNHATGYAVGINTSDGTTTLSSFWGTPSYGTAGVFRTEATINNFQQNSFESFWGYSNSGQAAYSPIGDNLLTGGTSLDAVWLDDLVVAEEDQPIPTLPGTVWRFGSRPGVTGGGVPYWVGGIDDAVSGTNLGYGLFLGTGASVVMKSGDVLPGTGGPIDTSSGVDFDYRFSAEATHSIVPINTTESTSIDNYMTVDGSALMIAGSVVQEGQPVPAAAGGMAGELWSNFDYCGITEAGDWFFTGDTQPTTADDEIIVKNGQILYREGQTVDGEVLTGSIDDAYMNEFGHIAYIWDVVDVSAGSVEALYLDDRLLLKEGQPVDLDGDGTVEPTSLVVNFSDVVIGDDNVVYFVATVDVNGTTTTSDDIEALFRVQCVPVEYGVAKLNSTGGTSELSWSGEPSLGTNNFSLELSGLTPNKLGLAFYGSAPAMLPAFNHFVYVAPPVVRLAPTVCSPTGTVSIPVPIDASMVGTLRCFQYWQRDPANPDGTGVELSNGLSTVFCN